MEKSLERAHRAEVLGEVADLEEGLGLVTHRRGLR